MSKDITVGKRYTNRTSASIWTKLTVKNKQLNSCNCVWAIWNNRYQTLKIYKMMEKRKRLLECLQKDIKVIKVKFPKKNTPFVLLIQKTSRQHKVLLRFQQLMRKLPNKNFDAPNHFNMIKLFDLNNINFNHLIYLRI